jgi:hypothetical protein
LLKYSNWNSCCSNWKRNIAKGENDVFKTFFSSYLSIILIMDFLELEVRCVSVVKKTFIRSEKNVTESNERLLHLLLLVYSNFLCIESQ